MFRTLRQSSAILRYAQRAHLTTSTRQIRGIQPSLIQAADQDFLHIANIPKKVYTVRPVAFWMDKILEKENKKPLIDSEYNQKTIEKNMSDSYVEEFLPFKSSPTLLDEYITTGGKIRIGKIFEDIDALAGAIAYKHVDTFVENSRPLTCVTASVDRMELLMPNTIEDLKLSGHVAYVGNSSMEVFVKLETMPNNYDPHAIQASPFPPHDFIAEPTDNTVLFARITFVAIDSITGKSMRVNPLTARNQKEQKLLNYAQDCKSRKKLVGQSSLAKAPPTTEERLTIHDIYMKYDQQPPSNAVWMEDTQLQSVLLMQPQNRNIHNKVFGGYLMKSAYELAHATGTMFTKSPVSLVSSDEIVFKKPVPVGSLLNLSSKVIHSQEDNGSFQVSVTANVTDIESNVTDTTNTFHFTLSAAQKVPKVLPKTYAESMLYLEGKRRSELGAQAKQHLLSLKN